MRTDCEECGRPLINPKYQQLGRGRICYIKKFGAPPPSTRTASVRVPRPARAVEPVLTGFPEVECDPSLLCRAAELVIVAQFPSPSFLMRKLRIGHDTAERLLSQMEAHGVVGPRSHVTEQRNVLVAATDVDAALDRIRDAK